jgi:hypothetical protein
MTLRATPSAISSPGSAGGPMQLDLLDGLTTGRSGPDLARVSYSASLESKPGQRMAATCGRTSSDSSVPPGPLSWLESRLRQRLVTAGLMRYPGTWKAKTTPSGRVLSRLSVSAPGIAVNGCGLLPTPSGTSNHGKNHVAGRIDEWGGQRELLPWDGGWPAALARLRAMDDGLPRCVEATDAARNAIVPQVAEQILRAYLDGERLAA